MTPHDQGATPTPLTVDSLAAEIRRVDGSHTLGAGALAEALLPFLSSVAPAQEVEGMPEPVAWMRTVKGGRSDIVLAEQLNQQSEEIQKRWREFYTVPVYPAPALRRLPVGEGAAKPIKILDKSKMYWAHFPHVPHWGPFLIAHLSPGDGQETGGIFKDVGWVRFTPMKQWAIAPGWEMYWVDPKEIVVESEAPSAALSRLQPPEAGEKGRDL